MKTAQNTMVGGASLHRQRKASRAGLATAVRLKVSVVKLKRQGFVEHALRVLIVNLVWVQCRQVKRQSDLQPNSAANRLQMIF